MMLELAESITGRSSVFDEDGHLFKHLAGTVFDAVDDYVLGDDIVGADMRCCPGNEGGEADRSAGP